MCCVQERETGWMESLSMRKSLCASVSLKDIKQNASDPGACSS